ncbi:MAG TPA: antibiotic biosynthesis monooxygenase [Nordella sp.]|nr:antibiotic biosynthesis monooxygenase [Nordella sp.]
MILEHALLQVRSGCEAEFEAAMRQALPLIQATPGFLRLEVRPCLETKGRYLLLVEWETLEAHTQGFRGSERYAEWQRLLHHFYAPFPLVEHYGEAVAKA